MSDVFKRLRSVEGEEAGREALADLERFLSRHSHKALESLHEAGEELITVHKLNAPSTLHTTLTNTNCIENPFRNTRAKIGRVKRWRAETDQAERWLAYSLLRAEKGFRRIKGYRQIPVLLKSLGWPSEAVEASLRSALGPPGHPASGGNGLHSTTPHPQAESEANCRTGTGQENDKELHRNEDRDRQRVSTGFGTSPSEYAACFTNLDVLLQVLGTGRRIGAFELGFFRSEGDGLYRIGQTGVRASKESRLYIYPDEENRIVYILRIGTKETQQNDINEAKKTIGRIRASE
ncbi:hypothetical protein L21SP4_02008 [Kiritimatiella glycovorans]|uniref:Transposase n=1 Tax=Kiritimatiella glycovorans TaxID=1307763 RepID=A0A0G3EIH6_9BACT|nr:hypothetical protein L21SP4_02008 [Kiritimatiella glycovorans]